MRIKQEEVEKIVGRVIDNLKKKGLMTLKAPEQSVKSKMVSVFVANLEAEDKLDLDVEEILKKFQGDIDSGRIDYRKMFLKVKNQLAKERKIVL